MSLPIIAYKISKIALNEFTRWLAFENAPHNIRCNVLMLGYIDTPLAIEGNHSHSGKPRDVIRRERDQSVPMGRMGTAMDIAYGILYLASDESSFVTGSELVIDGGTVAQSWILFM